MENKVSVIIPVYNVEKYLKKCVSSVCKQTYENLEIILVDDGSPDKSGALCDKLAKKDSRIVAFHKKNGGVSSARNIGIERATGKYITFVDSDDWLPENAIENLVCEIENNKSDFCFGTGIFVGLRKNQIIQELKPNIVTIDENYKLVDYHIILRSPWAKLYKTDIIKNYEIRFNEKIKFGEDRIFVWEYLRYCSNISVIKNQVYYYSLLNENNACSKYYEEFNIWLKEYVDAVYQTVKCGNLSASKQLSFIRKFGFREYVDVCEMYMTYLNDNKSESINKLIETTDVFSEYIFLNNENFDNEEYNEILSQYVLPKKFDEFYEYLNQKNCNANQSHKATIRKVLLKIKRFFIYRLS